MAGRGQLTPLRAGLLPEFPCFPGGRYIPEADMRAFLWSNHLDKSVGDVSEPCPWEWHTAGKLKVAREHFTHAHFP